MKYCDIKIENDDLALDGVQARMIYDRDVILQDLCHALRESGILLRLVGERSREERRRIELAAIMLAEDDTRIRPGTATLQSIAGGYLFRAETYEFGTITTEVLL